MTEKETSKKTLGPQRLKDLIDLEGLEKYRQQAKSKSAIKCYNKALEMTKEEFEIELMYRKNTSPLNSLVLIIFTAVILLGIIYPVLMKTAVSAFHFSADSMVVNVVIAFVMIVFALLAAAKFSVGPQNELKIFNTLNYFVEKSSASETDKVKSVVEIELDKKVAIKQEKLRIELQEFELQLAKQLEIKKQRHEIALIQFRINQLQDEKTKSVEA